jgi:hypothetical protein
MTDAREDNGRDPERYETGWASLAREVLKDGLRRGEKHLEKSMWTEFLMLHAQMMRNGTVKAGAISSQLKRKRK